MSASAEIASLQAELDQYRQQLDDVCHRLKENPDSHDLVELRENLEQFVELQTTAINDLKLLESQSGAGASLSDDDTDSASRQAGPAAAAAPVHPPQRVDSLTDSNRQGRAADKSSHQDDPLLGKTDRPALQSFRVNDEVSARWVSGDRRFYPARVTAISGKSTDPVYTVIFKIDHSTESVRQYDIKPLLDEPEPARTDDKAASEPVSAGPSAPAGSTGAVAKKPESVEGEGVGDAGQPGRKIRNKRELEAGKSKWQQFSQQKMKKAKFSKKESIFRTGDGVNARVGFTGSGQAMRKDPARTRHTYQFVEDEY